jgi:hypothetical protein
MSIPPEEVVEKYAQICRRGVNKDTIVFLQDVIDNHPDWQDYLNERTKHIKLQCVVCDEDADKRYDFYCAEHWKQHLMDIAREALMQRGTY